MHTVTTPRFLFSALFFLAVVTTPAIAAPEILEFDGGWYKQPFKPAGVVYIVDSIGRTCFAATSTGMTQVTCKSLKRRPEWAAIITWERKVKSTY